MLRKFLVSTAIVVVFTGAALAADLPSRKGPALYVPPGPPIFTWTVVYIGGQIGYQWGSVNTAGFGPGGYLGNLPTLSPSGVTGGGHIGYNYQIGPVVLGLEGDVDGSSTAKNGVSGTVFYNTRELVEGSVRGRLGYAWDRALIYATGGAAFGDFQNNYASGAASNSLSTTRIGWTVGGGVEYAFDNNWSARVEYRYTDFGRYYLSPSVLTTAFGATSAGIRETDNRVQVGFSYKFDLGGVEPIVDKY